jgi:hypothetical protein
MMKVSVPEGAEMNRHSDRREFPRKEYRYDAEHRDASSIDNDLG